MTAALRGVLAWLLLDGRRALRRYRHSAALRVLPGRCRAERIAVLEAEVERLAARLAGLTEGLHLAVSYAGLAVPDALANAGRPHLHVVGSDRKGGPAWPGIDTAG